MLLNCSCSGRQRNWDDFNLLVHNKDALALLVSSLKSGVLFKTLRVDSRPHSARTVEVSEMEVAI